MKIQFRNWQWWFSRVRLTGWPLGTNVWCALLSFEKNKNKFETNGIFRQKADTPQFFSIIFLCRHTSVQLCIHHNFAENNGSCFFFFIVQRWVCSMHVKTNSWYFITRNKSKSLFCFWVTKNISVSVLFQIVLAILHIHITTECRYIKKLLLI